MFFSLLFFLFIFFFFKQKTAYEMRISDWSSDVCSSDLCVETSLGQIDHRDIPAHPVNGYVRKPRLCTLQDRRIDVQCGYPRNSSGQACEIGRASCRERVCQYV